MLSKPSSGRRALRRGRYSETNRAYVITTVTDRRRPWFGKSALAGLMSSLLIDPEYRQDARFLCWVVMPDHVHVLLQLGHVCLDGVVRRLKGVSARRLNQEIGRTGRFWAPGYHDHAIRTDESLVQAARYIIANPLRAGLVQKIGDYPWWNAMWLDGGRSANCPEIPD